MNITENQRLGNFLKYEADKNYCRETMVVADGEDLKIGTIVGIVTATDEIKAVALTGEDETKDGAEVAWGIVIDDCAAGEKAVVVARDAIICDPIFPEAATVEQKKKITKDLEARGIVIRKNV